MPAWCASTWATATSRRGTPNPSTRSTQEVFNPWLNLHCPCMFASDTVSPKGKVVKRYRHADVKTPLTALDQLCSKGLARLKEGVTLAALQATAQAQTDLAAAQEMQRAKAELFRLFNAHRAQPTKAA